jgi:hypothetical protein
MPLAVTISEGVSPAEYPRDYRQLINKQNTLGWHQLLNGQWSRQWSLLQDQFLLRHFDPIPNQLSGRKWTTAQINFLWRSFWNLWDLCNGRVHGVNTTTSSKIQKEKAHCGLVALHALSDQTQHCDRDLFYDTAEDTSWLNPFGLSRTGCMCTAPLSSIAPRQQQGKQSKTFGPSPLISPEETILTSDTPDSTCFLPPHFGPGCESTLPMGNK